MDAHCIWGGQLSILKSGLINVESSFQLHFKMFNQSCLLCIKEMWPYGGVDLTYFGLYNQVTYATWSRVKS
jgi:hypothetical protein